MNVNFPVLWRRYRVEQHWRLCKYIGGKEEMLLLFDFTQERSGYSRFMLLLICRLLESKQAAIEEMDVTVHCPGEAFTGSKPLSCSRAGWH